MHACSRNRCRCSSWSHRRPLENSWSHWHTCWPSEGARCDRRWSSTRHEAWSLAGIEARRSGGRTHRSLSHQGHGHGHRCSHPERHSHRRRSSSRSHAEVWNSKTWHPHSRRQYWRRWPAHHASRLHGIAALHWIATSKGRHSASHGWRRCSSMEVHGRWGHATLRANRSLCWWCLLSLTRR